MTANITFTNGTQTVTIHTTSVDETYVKILTTINPAVSKNNWSAGPKDTKVVDLLRVTHRFEIDGYITATEGSFGSGDSSSTASGKRTDLKNIFKAGGVFTMTYEGVSYTVNSDKVSIKEENQDSDTPDYNLKISVLEGVNI